VSADFEKEKGKRANLELLAGQTYCRVEKVKEYVRKGVGAKARERRNGMEGKEEKEARKRTSMSQSLTLSAHVRLARRALSIVDGRIFMAEDASGAALVRAVKRRLGVEELAEVLREGRKRKSRMKRRGKSEAE
jgi:hypothetical protein